MYFLSLSLDIVHDNLVNGSTEDSGHVSSDTVLYATVKERTWKEKHITIITISDKSQIESACFVLQLSLCIPVIIATPGSKSVNQTLRLHRKAELTYCLRLHFYMWKHMEKPDCTSDQRDWECFLVTANEQVACSIKMNV